MIWTFWVVRQLVLLTTRRALRPTHISLSQCNHPSHLAIAGHVVENSDSCSDDVDGDLSSSSPSPAGAPSVEASTKRKMA